MTSAAAVKTKRIVVVEKHLSDAAVDDHQAPADEGDRDKCQNQDQQVDRVHDHATIM